MGGGVVAGRMNIQGSDEGALVEDLAEIGVRLRCVDSLEDEQCTVVGEGGGATKRRSETENSVQSSRMSSGRCYTRSEKRPYEYKICKGEVNVPRIPTFTDVHAV